MPPKKTKGTRKGKGPLKGKRKKPPPPEPLGLFWMLMSGLGFIASVGLFISISFPDWRVAKISSVHWIDRNKRFNSQFYNPSKYGLYTISFNGGVTSEPWYQKTARMCAGIANYAPLGSPIGTFISLPCPEGCISHYRTRCSVYTKLTTIGYVALGTCIIVGLLSLVGVGWTLVFGLSPMLLQIFWLGGGIANLFAIGYWIFESDVGMKELGLQSQYPYATLSTACFAGLAFSFALLALGLVVTFAVCFKDMFKQEEPKGDQPMDGTDLYGMPGSTPFSPGPAAYPFSAPAQNGPPPGFGYMGGAQPGGLPPWRGPGQVGRGGGGPPPFLPMHGASPMRPPAGGPMFASPGFPDFSRGRGRGR